MNMHFEASSNVMLLFNFWDVRGPAGMVLSVFVVLLFTVIYEFLHALKVIIGKQKQSCIASHPSASYSFLESCFSSCMKCQEGSAALPNNSSEITLASTENNGAADSSTAVKRSWLLHCLQTTIHIFQITLGYMLMLCVMSYNVWIFLGIIIGSVLGYFLSFPLLK